MRVGNLPGAVGQYAAIDPEVERIACEQLGLEPAPSSTQILQRDRHAELLSALALPGSSPSRLRAARKLDADPPARPTRRAAVRAGAARLVARPVRDRDPTPRADRVEGGRGA